MFGYIPYFITIYLQLESFLRPLIITHVFGLVRPISKYGMRGNELAILDVATFLLPLMIYQATLSSVLGDIHIQINK